MRPTTERRQNHHPSYPPNGPQSLPPWRAAAATVTKVWDWSGAVTQSPTSGCYAYRPGRAHEVFWTWPWGAPGCMPEPGALLFRRPNARSSVQGDLLPPSPPAEQAKETPMAGD